MNISIFSNSDKNLDNIDENQESTKLSSNDIPTNQTFYEGLFLKTKLNSSKNIKEINEDQSYLSSQNSLYNLKNKKLKKQKKIQKKSNIKKKTGCKCKKSNCLRLHCSCFSILGFCLKFCKCENCLNLKYFKGPREFVIKKTRLINKNAFKSEKLKFKSVNGFKINVDGCSCSKSCINNYCGCRKMGGKCSNICKCQNCFNFKVKIERDIIREIYKPVFRKKEKIIIDYDKSMIKVKKNVNTKKYGSFFNFLIFFFLIFFSFLITYIIYSRVY